MKKNKLFIWFSCLLVAFVMFISVGISVNADSWGNGYYFPSDTFIYEYQDNEVTYLKSSLYDFDNIYIDYFYTPSNNHYRDACFKTNSIIDNGYNTSLSNNIKFSQGDGSDPWQIDIYSRLLYNDFEIYMLSNIYTTPFSSSIDSREIVFEKSNFWLTLEMVNDFNSAYYFRNNIDDISNLYFDLDYEIEFSDGYQSTFQRGETLTNQSQLFVLPNNTMLNYNIDYSNRSLFIKSLRYRVYNFSLPCYVWNSSISYISTDKYAYYYDNMISNYRDQVVDNASVDDIGNLGTILLDSANSFLNFEIIHNFTLLNLLFVVVAIPLLIYILKLFLGG